MSYKWRGSGGFTLVEILVVVAVLSLIGGTVASAHVYMKNRATERVVVGDLDTYAQAQMSAWTEEGRFQTHEQLLASRFDGWSDDVELSEVRTADDRFFVRVRHTRTGYSCALDLSPRTGRAINRKVCRSREADPALGVPPGIVVTRPWGDTTTLGRPPVTGPAGESVLLPPEVGDVAEVVLTPGESRVVDFPVTNRSSVARTFHFGVSSANPDAVPEPPRPAGALLEASETAGIPVTVSVTAGALADFYGDVELRAADVADRAYEGTGTVRVRAALVLAAPAVIVPASEVRDAGETFVVSYRVRNRTNAARVLRFGALVPEGALSVASPVADQTFDAFEERVVPVTFRLHAAADGGTVWSARLVVTDRDAPGTTTTSDPFEVTTRLILAAPLVEGFPARTENPGAEITVVWQVTNRSNAARELRLVPTSDSPDLRLVSRAAEFTQRIGRGEVARVPVTYRMASGATCTSVFSASLRAEDAREPRYVGAAVGTLQAATVLAAPTVVAPTARSDLPGAAFTATWRVTNRSNCERNVRVDVLGAGDVAVSGASGAGVLRLQPFAQQEVEVSYRLDARSVHGTESRLVIKATDESASAFRASGSFVETTALNLCAPTVGNLAGPGQPQQPGTRGRVTQRVTNCSNSPRGFRLHVGSGNPATVPDPADPAAVTIPAFGSVDVSYGYGVSAFAAGGSFADLVLQAVDQEEPGIAGEGTFRVTAAAVLQPPVWGTFPAQEVRPGTGGAATAVLTSRSNVPAELCFMASVTPGSVGAGSVVAPGPPAPACIRLGAFQSATVRQAFSVVSDARYSWTNAVVVRAYDAARPTLASDQSFVATAGLVLAAPQLEVPATPPPVLWQVGLDRAISYPVTNHSNALRDLCLVVRPVDDAVVAVDDRPVCAAVAPGQRQPFVHTLRGNADREGAVNVSVHDRLVPEHRAEGRFGVRVSDARPVAVWTPPSPVYVRKWAEFDGRQSFSPVGARLVKYIWNWGLFNQQWTGARFEPGGGGVATDELSEPETRRAWDIRGTFQVCLTVEDETGLRSAPTCGEVNTLAETRARLAFRYRGWWHEPSDFCLDVPWDDQCPKEHGNARWEILLGEAQGDVPIARAWAAVQVEYWQTDDEFERTYTYSGNVEALPFSFTSAGDTITYDFFSNRPSQKASGSVQSGRWRVLDTNGTGPLGWPQPPELARHALVLNANLGSATGIFDGGPHWVPNAVWITLYVQDAYGKVTQQSRHLDHDRTQWRGAECIDGTSGSSCVRGYERLTPPQEGPVVSIDREDLGSGTYRFTGWGSSPDGRIVDRYWAITSGSSWDPAGERTTTIHRVDSVEVGTGKCEAVDVALVYVDDRSQHGRASETLSDADPLCSEIPTVL